MKRDVTVSVKGNQAPPYSDEVIETVSAGRYAKRNGTVYVHYDEVAGECDTLSCLLKIHENSVEISKKGPVSFYMYFEKDRKCITSYSTIFGNISVGVRTNEIIILRDEDEILIKILYDIMLGSGNVSENSVDIKISSAGSE